MINKMKEKAIKGLALGTILIMVFMVFAGIPMNMGAIETCPDGMVSYWRFNEGSGLTVTDSCGDNDGTIIGAEWTTGIVDGALNFDGNDDYVEVADDNSLHLSNAITVEVWAKLNKFSGYRTIATKDRSGNSEWWFGYNYRHELDFKFNNQNGINIDANTAITDDDWHHLVGVYDGSYISVYVDGVLDCTPMSYEDIDPDTGTMNIGYTKYWNCCRFKGNIDEVAIYNIALTPDEIEQHYENGLEGKGYFEDVIEAEIDIDPDTLNLKGKGIWITAYIELPENYDVNDIDVNIILLNGEVSAESKPTEIDDYDIDEIPDLMVKFDKSDVCEILETGNEVEITITGELIDGTQFEGSDTIRVID